MGADGGLLAHRPERTRRAHTDAIPAINASRIRQIGVVLGGDARAEAATGHSDGEGELGVGTAGLDSLVTHDAAGVAAHVEIIVDLDGLRHGPRGAAIRAMMVPSVTVIPLTGRRQRARCCCLSASLSGSCARLDTQLSVTLSGADGG